MSTGVQLATSAGQVFFDSDHVMWNYLGSFIAPAGGGASLNIPAMSLCTNFLLQRSFVDSPPGNQEAYIHDVSYSGTTVYAATSATAGNVQTLVVVLGN